MQADVLGRGEEPLRQARDVNPAVDVLDVNPDRGPAGEGQDGAIPGMRNVERDLAGPGETRLAVQTGGKPAFLDRDAQVPGQQPAQDAASGSRRPGIPPPSAFCPRALGLVRVEVGQIASSAPSDARSTHQDIDPRRRPPISNEHR